MKNEETLGEILGHSNFDGENWAVGDSIVFEDGTSATVEKKEQFHVWTDPTPAELGGVLAMIRSYGDSRLAADELVDSFGALFERLSAPKEKSGEWRTEFIR